MSRFIRTIGGFLLLPMILIAQPANSAIKPIIKIGSPCQVAGKTTTLGNQKITCSLVAGKKVWGKTPPVTPAPVSIHVTYGTDLHGSISGNAHQNILPGQSTTEVTAVPEPTYEFVSWNDGFGQPTRSDFATQDLIATASFKQVYFTLNYAAGPHGTITGSTSQKVLSGTRATSITAIGDEGYVFEKWSDGSTEPTRSDPALANNSLTASFKAIIPFPEITGHSIGKLLWSDEFKSTNSTAINSKYWTARNCGPATTNGGSTCMTGEVQYYAPSAVKLDGTDNLIITATHTASPPPDAGPCGSWGGGCPFVSGRLDTQGKVSFQYGYIEAKIKMPKGGGNWPAFWMLGNNITSVGWPTSGEIDIVEAGGDKPSYVHGSLNYKGSNGAPTYVTEIKSAPSDISADFHTYGLLWLENSISFYFDGELYETQTPSSIASPYWNFNAPFFVILNNAIAPMNSYYGGNWDGWQTSTMSIDYVRAWQVDGQGKVTQP